MARTQKSSGLADRHFRIANLLWGGLLWGRYPSDEVPVVAMDEHMAAGSLRVYPSVTLRWFVRDGVVRSRKET
jgi:hypothetical protein